MSSASEIYPNRINLFDESGNPIKALSPNDLHIAYLRVSQSGPWASLLDGALLSSEEYERASRFRLAEDRNAFVIEHSLRRLVLGHYLGIAPKKLSFRTNPFGKPALEGRSSLCFNASHSKGMVAYAIAMGREVGIDVERIREDLAATEIASRFFSPAETKAIVNTPTPVKSALFFKCWARKEAYIKAVGKGLSIELNRFEVSLNPTGRVMLLNTQDDPWEALRWNLYDLDLNVGYAAAVAVEKVRHQSWDKSDHQTLQDALVFIDLRKSFA